MPKKMIVIIAVVTTAVLALIGGGIAAYQSHQANSPCGKLRKQLLENELALADTGDVNRRVAKTADHSPTNRNANAFWAYVGQTQIQELRDQRRKLLREMSKLECGGE